MPLDITDYEKISMSIQSVLSRIDLVESRLMSRSEYEARHKNLSDRVQALEDSFRSFGQASMTEHEKIRQEFTNKVDDVVESLDKLDNKFDESRSYTLRTMIGIIVSFLLGGGLIGYLQIFHVIK